MGITGPIEEYEKHTLKLLKLKYKGLRWCELGNQRTDQYKVAKDVYQSLGVRHTSIDLNGEDRSLPIDLNLPIPSIYINYFDVLTDYGTVEHINNQFWAFKNAHDMCKRGGVMIHVLPLVENWPKHCRYYYSKSFMTGLAKACGYKIINYRILDKFVFSSFHNSIAVSFVKKTNNKFISQRKFSEIEGLVDTGDMKYVGDYAQKIRSIGWHTVKWLKEVF